MMKHFIFFLSFILLLVMNNAHAAEPHFSPAYQELLVQQQRLSVLTQSNTLLQTQLHHLQQRLEEIKTKSTTIDQERLQRAKLDLALTKTELIDLINQWNVALKRARAMQLRLNKLKERLQSLMFTTSSNKQLLEQEVALLRNDIEYQRNACDMKNAEVKKLQESSQLLNRIIILKQNWIQELERLYQKQKRESKAAELLKLAQQVQDQQKKLLEKLAVLNKQAQNYEAKNQSGSAQAIQLNMQIFQLEQEIDMGQLRLTLADISSRMDSLVELISTSSNSISELNIENRQAKALLNELRNLQITLTRKTRLIRERQLLEKESRVQSVISAQQLQNHQWFLNDLLSRYQVHQTIVTRFIKVIQQQQMMVSKKLDKAVSQRKNLPGFDLKGWLLLFQNLTLIPLLVWQYVRMLMQQVQLSIHGLAQIAWMKFIFSELILLSTWIITKRYLSRIIQPLEQKRQRISANVVFVFLELLRRNVTFLFVCAAIIIGFICLNIGFKSYALLFYLLLVWLAFRVLYAIARILLLENIGDMSGSDVRLYDRLKWILIVGAIVAALTITVHELPTMFEVRNLFERLCMVFLLLFAWVLWRGHKLIPRLIKIYLNPRRIYLMKVIQLFCLLIPLILFSNAMIGLLGYMALAWKMSYYQLIFLVVLATYVIARGLWSDLMDFLSELSIRYLKNGWLWSESLLKPLDRLVRIGLFISAWLMLFTFYDWGKEPIILRGLYFLLSYKLLSIAGTRITLLSVIKLFVTTVVLFWAARWSREFAYRWLFSNVVDRGLRNSLAVFTQYATVIIGIFIILRVLGISLTGLSVVLGGLAVGLGFGLRDFANNFVSGVLLLIERPVRVGDTVSVGGHEGEVVHIGMRSMIVKTWDYMEVLVPNSEIFSKTFVNWTRQDNIVRTVISIKINRDDNPHDIQKIIGDVLATIPEVVTYPEPEVFLKEMNDALMEFEVRYFINLVESQSRAKVRSKVLFVIWDKFEQLGIKPPTPLQDVYIKSLPINLSNP